jgi:putative membrane-bound dehydrogenase-like protein
MGSCSRKAGVGIQKGGFRTRFLIWLILVLIAGRPGSARAGGADIASATNSVPTNSPAAVTNGPSSPTPPAPPRAETTALSEFLIKPGFRIEEVASESLVKAPVAMAFDENGRLFVAELPGYVGATGARAGRIRLLEDTDGDGVFDASTIYADNVPWPSAIASYEGGVFVAAGPEVIYLKDNRSDGVADSRRVVFSGFGGGTRLVSPELQISDLTWGPDNRFHAVTAGLGWTVPASEGAGEAMPGDDDFSFDPRASKLFTDAGSAQSGLTFDNRGRRYAGDFSRPLRLAMYELPYFTRGPFVPRPEALIDSASPATSVYRWTGTPLPAATSPAVVRARTGPSPGLTNLLAPRWLTNAHSAMIYRGSAFPAAYHENAFMACPEAALVHREVLHENGLEVTTSRAADERGTEFLISKEPSFRPLQIINGPDGGLYIADFYHGADGGRVFRVLPAEFRPVKLVPLGKEPTRDLVATLAHTNAWQRDTAARLLYERRDPGTVFFATNMLANSRAAHARLQSLQVLEGFESFGDGTVIKALHDPDERVRERGVRLAEKMMKAGRLSNGLWTQLRSLTADPSIHVRYQLAFALGETQRPERIQALAQILGRDPANRWILAAVASSVDEGAGALWATLANDNRFRNDFEGRNCLQFLATTIGASGRPEEQAAVIDTVLGNAFEHEQNFSFIYALGEGLHRAGSSLVAVDHANHLQPVYDLTLVAILNDNLGDSFRTAAMQMRSVSFYTHTETGTFIQLLPGSRVSPALQAAAVSLLGKYDDPNIPRNLVDRWGNMTPALRTHSITALLGRTDRVAGVLTEVENGRISAADFNSVQIEFLRTYRDSSVRERAAKIFGSTTQRAAAFQKYKPALSMRGDAERGRRIFEARCARCHTGSLEAAAFGPDLRAAKLRGRENILRSVLAPNSEIVPGYATQVIETGAGENVIALKSTENSSAVTLRQPGGLEFAFPRSNIRSIESGNWSMMPEGLEDGLSPAEMADLLEYILEM